MIEPITYKQILNKDGSFEALELWQGSNHHITISLAGKGQHHQGYVWPEIKEVVERLSDRVQQEAQAAISRTLGEIKHD